MRMRVVAALDGGHMCPLDHNRVHFHGSENPILSTCPWAQGGRHTLMLRNLFLTSALLWVVWKLG